MSKRSNASERAIEDILVQSPTILASIIGEVPENLVSAARQQSVPSGRTDLVYIAGDEVILIELKVVEATREHVEQLSSYVGDYSDEKIRPSFAEGRELRPILLAPEIPSEIRSACDDAGLSAVSYELQHVLEEYQETMFANLAQFQVKGIVTSVAGLGLMNRYLEFLASRDGAVGIVDVARHYDRIGKGTSKDPESRVKNFRKAASGIGLIQFTDRGMSLTERGERYVDGGDYDERPWQVTAEQADEVIDLLYEDPFFSDLTYSMVALLESVFELSKNSHPVPREHIKDWYAAKVGKRPDWGDRTRTDVVRWLSTYLEELGLISRIGQQYYMTPEGFSLISHVAIDEGKAMIRSQSRRRVRETV